MSGVTDDRQTTDHATQKWVAIGRIASAKLNWIKSNAQRLAWFLSVDVFVVAGEQFTPTPIANDPRDGDAHRQPQRAADTDDERHDEPRLVYQD